MNKLQIAQAVQKEINSYAVGNPLVTTVLDENAPVQQRQIVGWLDAEYQQLWTEQPWAWKMANGVVITTVGSTADYTCETVGDDVIETFVPDTFKYRKVGESVWTPLIWLDYREWLDVFNVTASQLAAQRPCHITQLPSMQLRLTPAPDAVYEVAAQYELPFVPLVGDTAVPPWHSDLHDVLVYRVARNFLEEVSTAPLAARLLKRLAEREQTFINRYVP